MALQHSLNALKPWFNMILLSSFSRLKSSILISPELLGIRLLSNETASFFHLRKAFLVLRVKYDLFQNTVIF